MPIRRHEVIQAAVELLDEVGLDRLTTRLLAQRLGVHAGALYWHVANKQELLDAVADRIAEELLAGEIPTGDWTKQISALAHRLRAVMLAHRDGARLIVAGPSLPSRHTLAFTDRVMGVLRAAGAPLPLAAHGADTIFSYVTGFVLQEQAMQQLDVDEEKMAEFFAAVDLAALPNFAEWVPHLQLARDEPFDAGLALIVHGLATAISTSAQQEPAEATPAETVEPRAGQGRHHGR